MIDFMDIYIYYSVFAFTLFIVKKGGGGLMNLVYGSLFSSIMACFVYFQ